MRMGAAFYMRKKATGTLWCAGCADGVKLYYAFSM